MRESIRVKNWLSAAAAIATFATGAGGAQADVFSVNDTADTIDASAGDGICMSRMGTCTLRAAVMQANATPGYDVIQIPAGVYNLTLADPNSGGAHAGDLDIHDAVGLVGTAINQVVIDAGDQSRVFEIHEGVPLVTMEGFTIQEGNAFAEPDEESTWAPGGGIKAHGEELIMDGLLVTRNTAEAGGGIDHRNRLTIRHSRIHQNTAAVGGGIRSAGAGDLLFSESVLWGNYASKVSKASQPRGAGFYGQGTAHFERSSVVYNASAEDGGGIYFEETSGEFTLENVTISHNQAGRNGGGIFTWPTFHARNTTITENYSQKSGAAVYNFGYSYGEWGQTAEFEDSILHDNVTAQGAPECVGDIVSNGHNIFPAASACPVALATGDLPAGTDPQIASIQFQHTHYHPILWTSPALDAGSANCVAVDQRGVARPQGNGCDIGAYESEKDPDAPIAYDDAYDSSSSVGPISIPAPGVLANDVDPNGATLTAVFVGIDPNQGAVTLQPSGAFVFTPAGFTQATRTFTYRASNGPLDSNIATVSVTSGYRYEPEVLFEVPELPWLDPGPYRHECIAIWNDGTIAAQTFGAGKWSPNRPVTNKGSVRGAVGTGQSFEAILTTPEHGDISLEGSWSAHELTGSGVTAEGKRFEFSGRANGDCNALVGVATERKR